MERMTRQKRAVLRAIEQSGRSLHPSEIQSLAQTAVPTLNLSTVYRQLKTLVSERRVHKVELPGQPARFEVADSDPTSNVEAATEHPHHHHFHCVGCEQVFPIHGCPGPMEHLAPSGFRVESHDLTLHGRCPDCAAHAPQD
jgi:Fur family ferric uptake transcriptional regulator